MTNQSAKILMITSQEEPAQSLSSLLLSQGITTEITTDTGNVISKLGEFSPQLIVLNTILENVEIEQLLTDIRKQRNFEDVAVIVLAEFDATKDKRKLLELNKVEYIDQHLGLEGILTIIKLHLRLNDLQQELNQTKYQSDRSKKSYTNALAKISQDSCQYLEEITKIAQELQKSQAINTEEKEQIGLIEEYSDHLLNTLALTSKLNRFRETVDHSISETQDSETKKDKQSQKIQDLRILLAEDTVMNQKVAIHMLKKLGYEADIVSNGVEVLQALKNKSYDVILMDLMMPEMDGIETTRRIFEEFKDDKRPTIIAVTANVLPESKDACLAVGMNGYITKPFYLETLAQVLEQCRTRLKN